MDRLPFSKKVAGGFSSRPATGKLPDPLPHPLYLNLGCGKDVREGFINIDLFSDDPSVINMDVRKLDFKDNEVDAILASDILEHFSHRETLSVLREWARVLAPGGQIIIRCPSLKRQMTAYMSGAWDADVASQMIFGGQTNKGDYHCAGFDEASIRKHLSSAGMEILSFQEEDVSQNNISNNLNMIVRAVKVVKSACRLPCTGQPPGPGVSMQVKAPNASTPARVSSGSTGGSPHILFTMAGWNEGAGGSMLPRQIAESLSDRGYRVTVLTTSDRTAGDSRPYEVRQSREARLELAVIQWPGTFKYSLEHPESEINDPRMRRTVAGLVGKLKPDIVHYHSIHNFSLGTVDLIHGLGIPGINTSHNYWPLCPRMYLFKGDMSICGGPSEDGSKCAACIGCEEKQVLYGERARLSRQILNRCIDRHVAVSQRARQIFIQNGYDASRLNVIPLQPKTAQEIWDRLGRKRQPEGLIRRPVRVGFIGNLFTWKGVHVLMEAIQGFRPDQVECHVFGDGSQSYMNRLGQMDRRKLARFHGGYRLSQLPGILALMDVAVFPSICEETGGLAVLEALAGRVPVIGSRIGGIPEIIRDGETGILFEPGNANELARALGRLVRNPGLLGIMQANITAPRGFSGYVNELAAHYESVMAAHPRGH